MKYHVQVNNRALNKDVFYRHPVNILSLHVQLQIELFFVYATKAVSNLAERIIEQIP